VQSAVSEKPPWWLWPTILSLDAPAVALLWQALLAGAVPAVIGAPERFVLGCSVWLAYAADRWIEGWRLAPDRIRTWRHGFHVRWRWEIFIVWAGVLALDVAVAWRGLTRVEFRNGLLLLLAVAAYLLSHQLVHRSSRWRAPKEACVAALIAAGSALFLLGLPGAANLALPLGLFTLLCFANCVLISVWEFEVDRSHGQTSLALRFRQATTVSRALLWLIGAGSAALFLAGSTGLRPAAACAGASALLLGLVDLAERRAGRVLARVLADVALMTPAVPLLCWRLL
jgi:hypothetical protein